MVNPVFKRAGWIAGTNIYEVNLRQYSAEGTFTAFAASLPRLKDMGVEVLWLMPIHPIGIVNRKGTLGSYYSIADFKGVNPEFGTEADLKDLVEKVHALGMKLILDWVANHAAWNNVWTIDHPEYFVRDETGNFKAPYDWTDVIQIDHSNTAQQDAMIEAMSYWVTEFNIDGFRADLAHLTPLDFWRKARTVIEPLKPGLFWLAESEEIGYHEVFDASFTWEWMHTTEAFYKGRKSFDDLYHVLQQYEALFPATAYRMYFTSNHDENSWNGTGEEKYGLMLPALIVFSCTWNGIPLVYSGEEMPNRKRLKFFDKDAIAWDGNYQLHELYKTLFNLRHSRASLKAADPAVTTFFIITEGGKQVMAYLRKHDNDEVLVLLNLSNENAAFRIADRLVDGKYKDVFTGVETFLSTGSFIRMEPWAYLVYEQEHT